MHFFLFFILFVIFSCPSDGRPSPQVGANESGNRDIDYDEENDVVAEEYSHEGQESQQMGDDREEMARYEQQGQKEDSYIKSEEEKHTPQARLEYNKFSDYKTGKDVNEENELNVNVENNVAIPSSGQHINIYRETYEANDNEPMKILSAATRSRYRAEEIDPKARGRNSHSVAKDDGEMLFNNRANQRETDSYQYNNESPANENSRVNNEYLNGMQISNKRVREEKKYDIGQNVERDRRQVENIEEKQIDVLNSTPNVKETNVAMAVEDSETAIKNKVKKLSKEELEDLLNSLSEDRKLILKKVIEDKDVPNKREITKKAGAIDENSFIENSQIDMRNFQGECSSESNFDLTVSQSGDTTSSGSPNESNDTTSTKVSDTEKSSEKSNSNAQLAETNPSEDKPDADSSDTREDVKNEDSSKSENKRETNLDQLLNEDSLNINNNKLQSDYQEPLLDQSEICNGDENYANLENVGLQSEIKSTNKRETGEILSNYEDCAKSLRDSFPAENDVSNLKSNLAPLIRVKRTQRDHVNKKRDTNVSNIKVPFFPDAENENLDNDERSEFEDYGIFDREPHFAEREHLDNSDKSKIFNKLSYQRYLKSNEDMKDNSKLKCLNPEVDMSLGSDTDSVLNGVEGAEENIMYNSGLRKKRAVDNIEIMTEKTKARVGRTAGPLGITSIIENNISTYGLKEYEAFGPLSLNYASGITRYKRVREIPPHAGFKDVARL